jgi:hypothetical protein
VVLIPAKHVILFGMAVFIELTTDPFQDTFNKQVAAGKQRGRAGLSSVRRPLRGIEVKDDTYAVFRVIRSDGTEIPLIDSGGADGTSTSFSNFIITSLQEARMEKSQIIETFGETFIFFFGEQPRFLDVSAVLVNSNDFNWKGEFLANYDKYLRGTKLTELGACAYLFYDDNVVSGYLMQCQVVDSAEPSKELVMLQFRMVLCGYNNVSFVGDPNFPLRASVQLPAGTSVGDLSATLNGEQINQLISGGQGISGEIIDGQFVASSQIQRTIPLRGLISQNSDEWTGQSPISRDDFDQDPFVSTVDEVRDINQALAAVLPVLGVDGDYAAGPDFMTDTGTGPSFSEPGIGAGFGSSGGSTATFGASFGYSASFSSGVVPTQQLFTAATSVRAKGLLTGQSSGGAGVGAGFSPGPSFGIGASSGVMAGASYSGSTGAGGAISVGGDLTAFAFISSPGELDDSPEAQAQLQAAAREQFSLDFSDTF